MKTIAISTSALVLRQDGRQGAFGACARGLSNGDNATAGCAPQAHLTPRQLEVLALLCQGLPNKLICRRLNIAPGTVKVHISCILRELGVSSRLQAVLCARRWGLDAQPAANSSEPDGDSPVTDRPVRTGVATAHVARQLAAAA